MPARSTSQPDGSPVRWDEWAVFVRETPTGSTTHVGTVRAIDEETAVERARQLYPDVQARWLCPVDALARDGEYDRLGGEDE